MGKPRTARFENIPSHANTLVLEEEGGSEQTQRSNVCKGSVLAAVGTVARLRSIHALLL